MNDSPLGVSVAPDGSIYVGGFTDGDFASANQGSADVWLARFDAEGNELWRRQFGGPAWDRGFDVTAFDGGAYITGYTASTLDPATDLGGFDGFAARFGRRGQPAVGPPHRHRRHRLGPGLGTGPRRRAVHDRLHRGRAQRLPCGRQGRLRGADQRRRQPGLGHPARNRGPGLDPGSGRRPRRRDADRRIDRGSPGRRPCGRAGTCSWCRSTPAATSAGVGRRAPTGWTLHSRCAQTGQRFIVVTGTTAGSLAGADAALGERDAVLVWLDLAGNLVEMEQFGTGAGPTTPPAWTCPPTARWCGAATPTARTRTPVQEEPTCCSVGWSSGADGRADGVPRV